MSAFPRKAWDDFAALPENAYTRAIAPEELVDIASHRRAERMAACGGTDPLQALAAYAQDALVYDARGCMHEADSAAYASTPPEHRVNKFGQAYKAGSAVLLHAHLAGIVVDAAVDMHRAQGWTTVVFDGLRTMESGYLLYRNAKDEWLRDGLLAAPGRSAHNRALAADSMLFDTQAREVDVGGHFDQADMPLNNRNYSGSGISDAAKRNRLIRERAFMRAALARGTLVMPLAAEFWHDQVPGAEEDLWRVMESLCRCLGIAPPPEKAHSYAAFAAQWAMLDKAKMKAAFSDAALPAADRIVYHECLKPIYDRELPEQLRQALPI